jgi:hypothetical protein
MPRQLLVSPKGEAQWAKVLGEPVAYEDNPKAWSISLLLDPNDPETIAFIENLEEAFAEFHGKIDKVAANGWPFGDETTKDDKGRRVNTGNMKFNFKRKEQLASGSFKQPPVVVDAKRNPWPADQLIGNGSKVKIAFSPWAWSGPSGKGMSLELEQVQVLDLVSYSNETENPFQEEEGYVVAPAAPESPFEAEPACPMPEPTGFAAKLRARAAEVQAAAAETPF